MANTIAERLEASRDALMQALAGMDEQSFRKRPAPATWTAAELLAHLLHSERVLQDNVAFARTTERYATVSMTDEERDSEAKLAQRMAVPQILHGLVASRRDTLRLLEGMTADELARPVVHARAGEQTAGWLFERLSEHEMEHSRQIEGLKAAAGLS